MAIKGTEELEKQKRIKRTKIFLRKFGLRIKKLREKRGWTLEGSEELGYPDWSHLKKIESGKKIIRVSTLLNLAKLFDMSLSELLKDL